MRESIQGREKSGRGKGSKKIKMWKTKGKTKSRKENGQKKTGML
jgi:hypothetical protein